MTWSRISAWRAKVFSSSGSKVLVPYPGRSTVSTENPLRPAMSRKDPDGPPATPKYALV